VSELRGWHTNIKVFPKLVKAGGREVEKVNKKRRAACLGFDDVLWWGSKS
jgi:hypothetical protein